MKFQTTHVIAIGAWLTSVGSMLAGLEHGWHDALTPTFISGVVISLGSLATALSGDSVRKWDGKTERRGDPAP